MVDDPRKSFNDMVARVAKGTELAFRPNDAIADINRSTELFAKAQAERDRNSKRVAEASHYQLIAAETSVAQVVQELATFEATLTPDEEVALVVIGGPAGLTVYPSSVRALAPDKLVFTGTDQNGDRVTTIQHVTQLNLMLRAVKVAPGEPPRRYGFHHPASEGEVSA